MALIKCKECQKEISNKAKTCPQCGNPVPKSVISKTGCLLIIVGFVFVCIMCLQITHRPQISKSDITIINDNYKLYIKTGLIVKFEPEYHTVFVNPEMWGRIDFQNKEIVAHILADKCVLLNSSTTRRIEIKNNITGKTLAEYGVFGFKTY